MPSDPSARAGGRTEPQAYDPTNPFAQILRGELEVEAVYESEHALAFHDRDPRARYHVVVIPKGQHRSLEEFVRAAPPSQVAGFWRAVCEVVRRLGLDATGYRLLLNQGPDAHQEVPHLHVHVLGGEDLGVVFGPARGREGADQPAQTARLQPRRRGLARSSAEARELRRTRSPE